MLMSLTLARLSLGNQVGRLLFSALMVFGLATTVFGLSTSIPLSIAALVVLGAADAVSVVLRSSLVQLNTPDHMLGRVSAVNTLFVSASNQLGEFESGVMAALVGAVPAVVIGGLGTVAVAGLWMWWFPSCASCARWFRHERRVGLARYRLIGGCHDMGLLRQETHISRFA